jgi:methylmalonyl-CoA mutase cobalamin-binding subunit
MGSDRFDSERGSSKAEVHDALSDAIRMIVLPRMLAAHRKDAPCAATAISEADVGLLLSHVTTADPALAETLVTALRLRGVSRTDVLLNLFAVVARRLSSRWLRNECAFADVTLAIGRLRRLIRSESMPEPPLAAERGGRILVASLPGDQHAIGAAILEDLFRSAGWDTAAWPGPDATALERMATAASFDLIGIPICDAERLDPVPSLAERLRRTVPCRLIGFVACDKTLATLPEDPAHLGLDAIIRDIRDAEPTARAMLRC